MRTSIGGLGASWSPRKIARVFFAFVLAAVAIGSAGALESHVASVDITVSLRTDGKATVFYSLEWDVTSGTLGGFYFQGEAFSPVWDSTRCYADLPNGKRVALDIRSMGGGKYDVVLAGGKRTAGTSYWNLTYAGDFAAEGLVGRTESPEHGDLVRFSWAPVEWDQGLDSRTVRVVLPVKVSGETVTGAQAESVRLLTEPFVNRENRIDFYGSPGTDGAHYLTLRFYQENVPARGTQKLVFYLPAD